jgi:lysophospholipase L1-like esterase
MRASYRAAVLVLVSVAVGLVAHAAENAANKPAARRDNPIWMARHTALLERAKKGADVVFLGDALTQGWEGADGAAAWKAQFEPLKAANFGAGGDRTEHVLWRITEGGELRDLKPKAVVLQVGGGNLATNSADEIGEGVTAVVEELGRQKPATKVLLLGLLPRGARANDKFRDKIKEVNKGLAGLAESKKLRYIDVSDRFLDKEGNLIDETMPDGLHPSTKGYAVLAEAIKGPLEQMLKSGE